MALVNIDTVLSDTLRLLKKAVPPGGVLLLSYKRNRSIAIIKKDDTLFEIREGGYVQQIFDLSWERLTKELKTMMKREFPRSRKVRVVRFSHPEELDREWKIY
ncbi:MAG: hypothetical protein GXY53_06565 [Desulfobulbus sp.]|mgnify:CR=1 FL=1|nr:hypothetical protein [Desulfobulbus sp.]